MRIFCFSIFFIFFLFPLFGIGQSCNNWLKLNNQPSFVRVGDLDVSGNKLTVEATFNRTVSWSGTDHYQGDLVSKHEGPYDCNYLLRPGSAEITTTTGYYKTPPICEIELNKTYHVAMVYDGSSLKFYRNGFLMSQVAATGNLFQNDWPTQIGFYYLQLYSTNLIGYINEVRIWNIARSQAEIQSFMKQSLPSPNTIAGLMAYYTFDDLNNKQGNAAWNGALNGSASINEANPNCNIIVDSCKVSCPTPSLIDFDYQQSICSPKTILFSTSITGVKAFTWSFGNNQTNNSELSPAISYLDYGNYDVQLDVVYDNNCIASIKKNIPINNIFDNSIIHNADTSLCYGDSVLLRTTFNNLNYCWQTSNDEPPPVSLSEYIKPSVSTTYFINVQNTGKNIVNNGDFSSGNSGFTSNYKSTNVNTTEGEYWIGNNPRSWNNNFNNCIDHSTGSGNMMMVNGSPTPSAIVWSQTINISPNTNYAFSTWIQSLFPVNPAKLRFSINNSIIGNNIIAGAPCTWSQFSTTWNSGDNTTAEIKIINNNTIVMGNDFAIDDIFFGPITFKNDSVRIHVKPKPTIKTINDTSICSGEKIILNTTGGESYFWSPSAGLSSMSISSPEANPSVSTKYIVSGKNNEGCWSKDSVNITVNLKPDASLGENKLMCNGDSMILNAGNVGATYEWNNSYTSQMLTVKDTGYYHVKISSNGCNILDSVHIAFSPAPFINLIPDTSVCKGEVINLSLNAEGNYSYKWFPTNGLSDSYIQNPIVTVFDTIKYEVTVTNEVGCKSKKVIVINGLNTPLVELGNDTTLCPTETLVLDAQNNGANYLWNDGKTEQIKSINSPGVYYVTVTKDGCRSSDSIKISSKLKPEFTISPGIVSICKDEKLTLKGYGGESYQWFKDGIKFNESDSLINVYPEFPSIYSVIINEIQCGYSDTLFSEVTIKPLPQIFISKSNDISCEKNQSQLFVSGGVKYKWEYSNTINNINILNPIVSPVADSWYVVNVEGENGCTGKDSIKVLSNFSDGGKIYVPNAFSPNGNGKNDCFGINYWSPVDFFEFSIFNRWGEKVFFTNKPDCWNGYYKGKLQPEGVYIYLLNTKGTCGAINKKGTFVLLK